MKLSVNEKDKEIKPRKTEQRMKNYFVTINFINKRIEKKNIKKSKFAEKLGISKNRFSQILNKKREANGGELINIIAFLGFKISNM